MGSLRKKRAEAKKSFIERVGLGGEGGIRFAPSFRSRRNARHRTPTCEESTTTRILAVKPAKNVRVRIWQRRIALRNAVRTSCDVSPRRTLKRTDRSCKEEEEGEKQQAGTPCTVLNFIGEGFSKFCWRMSSLPTEAEKRTFAGNGSSSPLLSPLSSGGRL